MLAEKRSRDAYVLQPRGTALYADSSRFGTRMLKKMGWSEGKGLGPNQEGKEEFVRIKYRSNMFGLGFQDSSDGWTQHEESFNGFLNEITTNAASKPLQGNVQLKSESLEQRSKVSRVRVHYQKFARQKDISQYSQKDLANIFGRKSLDYEQHDTITYTQSEHFPNNASESKSHEADVMYDDDFEETIDNSSTTQDGLDSPLCGESSEDQNDHEQKLDKPNSVPPENANVCKWESSERVEYRVNTYNGIKFREVDLNGFPGSNIAGITGYGLPKNLKLVVFERSSDTDKIARFCYQALAKRKNSEECVSQNNTNVSLKKENGAPAQEMKADRQKTSFNRYIGQVKKRKIFEKI